MKFEINIYLVKMHEQQNRLTSISFIWNNFKIPILPKTQSKNAPNAHMLSVSDAGIGGEGGHFTQGLIETLGSMVIFGENQAVSNIKKIWVP